MSAGDLQALLSVQDLDTETDRARHRRVALPERATLAEMDKRAAILEATLEEATSVRDEVACRQVAAEQDLAATEQRRAAVSRRLYSGEVSASRELQAMSADVESLGARVSSLEDRILEILEEREPLDARVGELEAEKDKLAAERQEAVASLGSGEEAIDVILEGLASQRAEAAALVPPALLSDYEGIRARLGGVGAARLVGSRCDGCHLTLPATEMDRIRHLPEGELVTCDQCGRILVP
ncbi:MAG: zinc ribbon domain-containing protein [Acidimicrobiales bacterium]